MVKLSKFLSSAVPQFHNSKSCTVSAFLQILIFENSKIEIKPSMIQPVKEIKSLGKFEVKISLHSEVDAEITIAVETADTIQ